MKDNYNSYKKSIFYANVARGYKQSTRTVNSDFDKISLYKKALKYTSKALRNSNDEHIKIKLLDEIQTLRTMLSVLIQTHQNTEVTFKPGTNEHQFIGLFQNSDRIEEKAKKLLEKIARLKERYRLLSMNKIIRLGGAIVGLAALIAGLILCVIFGTGIVASPTIFPFIFGLLTTFSGASYFFLSVTKFLNNNLEQKILKANIYQLEQMVKNILASFQVQFNLLVPNQAISPTVAQKKHAILQLSKPSHIFETINSSAIYLRNSLFNPRYKYKKHQKNIPLVKYTPAKFSP